MKRVFLTGKFLAIALIMIAVFCFGQSESIIRTTEDWPTYIDPAVGSDFSDCIAIVNLYDSLVFPNADGSVRPHLATHWDVTPDGLTWTFYLRQGVKFHSGNELTAEDIVFSVNRLLTMGEGFAYMFEPFIDEVVALDPYTVQFKMKKPYGPFLTTLVRIYILEKDLVLQHLDSGPYGEFGDYGRKWLLEHDAGSGPYMVEEVKMEEYVLMKKFDDWWGGWEPNAPEYFKEMATKLRSDGKDARCRSNTLCPGRNEFKPDASHEETANRRRPLQKSFGVRSRLQNNSKYNIPGIISRTRPSSTDSSRP